ncbi:MAG: flagellar filament capping protein FliD [Roseburia sp.]|nr:flagellar filament capping protein FliD [Roseburia sp.]
MAIRLTGLTSGLDTESIISALVSSYSYKTNKYKKAQTKLSWKQDAWKALNTKVYSLYTSLDSMRFTQSYNLKSTSVSDATKAKVTASGTAPNGTQKLNILKIAQAGYLTGGKLAGSTTTGTTLAELGYTGGDGKVDLKLGDGTTKTITVSQGTTVNDFIKSLKDAGVSANYDTTNNRIYVSSKETGVDNDFTLTGANVDGANALTALGLNVNSSATEATYESYTQYYNADGTQLNQNVKDAITAYQNAKSAYDKANAQNSNMSSAYGYASAYSAMQDALTKTGLTDTQKDQLVKLLSMSDAARNNSIIGSDGNIYTAETSDEDGNTIYSYDDNGTKKYIKAINTYTGSDNQTYTLDAETGVYKDANGNEYKATGKKDKDGNPMYANTKQGLTTEISIKTTTNYYASTASEVDSGYDQIKVGDAVYKQDDDGKTWLGSDGKLYELASGANKLYEVTKDSDGNVTRVDGGKEISFEDSDRTDIMQTKYSTGAEMNSVKTAADTLSDMKTSIKKNASFKKDEDLNAFISTLTSNITAVNNYESATDTVLKDDDTYSKKSIVSAVHDAYKTNGATGVTSYVNGFANVISQNNTNMTVDDESTGRTSYQTVMKNNQVLADIAAMKDGTEKDNAIADFVQKVQSAHDISANTTYNTDAKKIDGTDAEITLNGIKYTGSSNSFSINGLNIEAQAVTGEGDANAISITTKTDTQGMYDKIKEFLSQYNSIINEITSLYNADSAKGYEPLTDDEKSAMSDKEVEKWEEKIKSSLLRRDDTLEGLMSSMTSAMSKNYEVNGKNYSLSSFGISTLGFLNSPKNQQYAYHIDGDEDDSFVSGNIDKLMTALTNDPDAVISFMQQLTSGLYTAVGDKMKSSSVSSIYTVYNDKEMASEYSDYTSLIKKWEEKLSDKQEYYYKKFSSMETALSKLNNQSSSFSSYFGS